MILPAAAHADKPKRHPSEIVSEFSFTGLIEYRQDMTGATLTCPDNTEPYEYEDHVFAHIAFDTVWRLHIRLHPDRRDRVFDSKEQHYGGSTWSISGKEPSTEECVPPQSYSCSGTFAPAEKAPIFFTPVGDDEWEALMQGAFGAEPQPDGCEYLGSYRYINNSLPDDLIERAVGEFDFTPERLLHVRNRTVTGNFNYSDVPSDCGSTTYDEFGQGETCTQTAEGSGGIRFHRIRIIYEN